MTDRELEHVEPHILTCDQVDERDLDAAYLAGRLTDEDAAAFEAHLFACDRCWPLLQAAMSVAAARTSKTPAASRRWLPLPLAAAAGIAAVLAGVWWTAVARRSETGEALRGSGVPLTAHVDVSTAGVAVRYGSVPGADRYRIRVFTVQGDLLAERETADTMHTIALTGGQLATAVVEVTALDALREPLASSGLVRADRRPSLR